jgi:hypothetical protein
MVAFQGLNGMYLVIPRHIYMYMYVVQHKIYFFLPILCVYPTYSPFCKRYYSLYILRCVQFCINIEMTVCLREFRPVQTPLYIKIFVYLYFPLVQPLWL